MAVCGTEQCRRGGREVVDAGVDSRVAQSGWLRVCYGRDDGRMVTSRHLHADQGCARRIDQWL
jgi:hypothetical protein